MKLLNILLQQFVALCEIPEMYAGIQTNSLTIDIMPIEPYQYAVTIDCLDSALAKKIVLNHNVVVGAMQRLNLAELQINVKNRFFRVFANNVFLLDPMNDLDVDLNSLFHSTDPVFIVAMHNHRLLFANNAALLANQKQADEFLGSDVAALSYPDELDYRHRMLRLDGKLENYEYKAMNWYKDGILWRRKEMRFVAHYQKVNFLGVECRVGIDLMAEETRRFVD